jgi:RNA polymerase sigma-70 factor, ECF subfamily
MHSADISLGVIGNEMAGQGDLGLVRAVRGGSEAAFAELHRLYGHRLYKTIFSITKNHEDAEDVLQETLLRAYMALDTFEGRSKLFSWLTRIAINTALMSLRKRRVRREASFEPLGCGAEETPQLEFKDPSPNPEEVCLQLERRRNITHAVNKLQPALQAVIRLHITQEGSLKEIAQVLDVSVAAVKSRLYRGRHRLAMRTNNEARMKSPHTSESAQKRRVEISANECKHV